MHPIRHWVTEPLGLALWKWPCRWRQKVPLLCPQPATSVPEWCGWCFCGGRECRCSPMVQHKPQPSTKSTGSRPVALAFWWSCCHGECLSGLGWKRGWHHPSCSSTVHLYCQKWYSGKCCWYKLQPFWCKKISLLIISKGKSSRLKPFVHI